MVEFTEEQIREFFSKKDFDFATVSGWREFLNERQIGGTGRDADGYHERDFTNYNVGNAQYMTRGPVDVEILVRPFAGSLQTPPGNLYVLSQNANWEDETKVFLIGTGFGTQQFRFVLGGPPPNGEEYWGQVYFIAHPTSQRIISVPGLRQMTRLLKAVGRGMSLMGVGYYVGVCVGKYGSYSWNNTTPQQIFAPTLEE